MYGIKARHQQTSGKPAQWGWYARRRKLRLDTEIRHILNLHRAPEATSAESYVTLPPVWGHKTEVLTGDTVYITSNNHIRSFILSALHKARPEEGVVSITSPIGRALLGRHQGDKIHLATLDGDIDYTVLKII